ncbi:hypothetical protein BD410DRAFT_767896 [Rickenella mellea]|uniref:Transcription factor IIIC putative zinc-finger domain-containing protein n=1 Tax=Rickenella mellea TaxID=50990 RepID=A0A4Y7Q9W1_9AGAM|nr:hypothetical protein BD410DRAFT_767896 [Rickenella mellea]
MQVVDDFPILTAVNVPTVAPQPSPNCLQWSGDGQLVVCTKAAVYLLTPDLGVYFDPGAVLNASLGKQASRDTLGWFRTLIEFDKVDEQQWPAETQEWGAVAFGSLDVSWRAVAISPSNLTGRAGCLLALMSSNMDISLWSANKNHLKGEWTRLQDVTTALKHVPLISRNPIVTTDVAHLRTLQAQIQSMGWSSQAEFGVSPRPVLDGSLLALGNRAGSVIFMRYDGDKSMQHVQTLRLSDNWVTHLSWSKWRIVEPYNCVAQVACGMSDGSVAIVAVSQTLESCPSRTPFGNSYDIHFSSNLTNLRPCEADLRGITALVWVEGEDQRPLVCYAKPGVLNIWRMPDASSTGDGQPFALRLQSQRTSVGSSSLTPVSGMNYDQHNDALLVTLFDGSFHIVYNLSSEPSLQDRTMDIDGSNRSMPSSALVSSRTRAAFERAEGSVQHLDVNRTSGALSFDGSSTVAWLHEACRPTDFSYKHDAKHNSMLVVSQLWDAPSDDALLTNLKNAFERPDIGSGDAPVHVLRRIFLHLRHPDRFDQLKSRIIGTLLPEDVVDVPAVVIPPLNGEIHAAAREEFRKSLASDMYGLEPLHSLRLRLAVADFCWKTAKTEDIREAFGNVAHTLLNRISHSILRSFVRHLTAVAGVMTGNELRFVLRVVVQSLLPGSPKELAVKANELSAKINPTARNFAERSNLLVEQCPACHAEVPLENIISATCPNGHIWKRCSITSFLLSTPMVRTCIGCTRKALLPPSQSPTNEASSSIPMAERSWIVEEILEAVRCCLYCGNRFVRVL